MIGVKKILFLTNEYAPGPGGIGNQAMNLVDYLVLCHYQVTVVTASRKGYNEEAFDMGIKYKVYRYSSGRGFFYKTWFSLRLLISFRGKCDLVFVSGLSQQFLIWPTRLLLVRRVISIIHDHEMGIVS